MPALGVAKADIHGVNVALPLGAAVALGVHKMDSHKRTAFAETAGVSPEPAVFANAVLSPSETGWHRLRREAARMSHPLHSVLPMIELAEQVLVETTSEGACDGAAQWQGVDGGCRTPALV